MRNKNNLLKIKLSSMMLLPLSFGVIAMNFSSSNESVSSNDIETNSQNSQTQPTAPAKNTATNQIILDKPQNFGAYSPLAFSDNSKAINTDYGYFGISSDKTKFYLTSYSGFLIWGQNIKDNIFLKRFYTDNNLTITNVKIKGWEYIQSKDVLALFVGDDSHNNQSLILLEGKSGLLYKPTLDDYYNVTKANIIKIDDGYSRMFQLTDGSLIFQKSNMQLNEEYIDIYISNDGSLNLTKKTFQNGNTNLQDKELITLIKAYDGKNLMVIKDKNPTPSNSNAYKQYCVLVNDELTSINSTNTVTISDYIDTANSNNSYLNWGFSRKINNNIEFYVFTGDTKSRNIEQITFENNQISKKNTIEMYQHDIRSVTINKALDRIFISNTSSDDGTLYGYIDLTKEKKEFKSLAWVQQGTIPVYDLIPVWETPNGIDQNIVILDKTNSNIMQFMKKRETDGYDISNSTFSLISRQYDFYNKIKSENSFERDRMPDQLSINNFNWGVGLTGNHSQLNTRMDYVKISNNNQKGVLHGKLRISYNWFFDTSKRSEFEIPFYFNGFYKPESAFNLTWVTDSNVDSSKWNKIEELRRNKFAKDVTRNEIFNNFFVYTIKDKNNQTFNITENMISYNGNYGNLDKLSVTINFPQDKFPIGFNLRYSHEFSGFKTTDGYQLNSKNDSEINKTTSKMYASQLTLQHVLDNFLNLGSKIKKDQNYWEFSIQYDEFKGEAIISLKYLYEKDTEITNNSDFPKERFNVYTNKRITTFKKLNDKFSYHPTITNIDNGSYLPSEIWSQYKMFESGKTDSSILIDNLSFSLSDKNDLLIECTNENSMDSSQKMDLILTLKNDSVLNVDYDGTIFSTTSDKKLIFDDKLKKEFTNNNIPYSYTLEWSITTANKYFNVVNINGDVLEAENNTYFIDIEKEKELFDIPSDVYADQITDDEIKGLVESSGYDVTIVERVVDVGVGRAEWILELELQDPPLVPNIASYYKGESNNLIEDRNFEGNNYRKIVVYNLKVPSPLAVKIMNYSLMGVGVLFGLVIASFTTVWIIKKNLYQKKSVNKIVDMENSKKMVQMRKKDLITKQIKQKKK